MKKIRVNIIFPLLLAVFFSALNGLSLLLTAEKPTSFARGEIIDNVVCKHDSKQSYTLYLPKNYSTDKKWPILFAFDPGARAKLPLELFKTTAEKYGYIVVCSKNSRNGPTEPIDRAIFAMWKDTRERFSIDTRRIYATGFSGGARAASRFHILTGNSCAGIIACGAGISPAIRNLERIKPAAWYGIVGMADFNYYEFMDLDAAFDDTGVIHLVDVIDLDHRWPPPEVCARAIDWMEIHAMKKGTRKNDEALTKTLYQKTLSYAHNLELSGRIYHAAQAYEAAQTLFNGLLDVSHAESKKNQITASKTYKKFQGNELHRHKKVKDYMKNKAFKAYKKFQEDENLRRQKVSDYMNNFARMVSRVEHSQKQLSLKQVLKKLKIAGLWKKAERKNDLDNSSMAFRVLISFSNRAYEKGSDYYRKKDYEKAIIFFEISVNADKRNVFSAYNLACTYSLNKQKKQALKALRLAVQRGFKNRTHIEKDTDLDFLRDEKVFKEIMAELEKGQE
jgi:tetratricopeptide (TPR) repeat protein